MVRRFLRRSADDHVEVGGWQSILSYVAAGLGVGLVTEEAVEDSRSSSSAEWVIP
ncbi:MAG: hypothetical protein R3C05_28365 [Pirellulaceae bacterium]